MEIITRENPEIPFVAQFRCQFQKVRYRKGDIVNIAISHRYFDDYGDELFVDNIVPAGNGGPWGWGGFTATDLKAIARGTYDLFGREGDYHDVDLTDESIIKYGIRPRNAA